MGLIRIIIIFILLYYLLRLVMRVVVPFLLGSYVNRKMNGFSETPGSKQAGGNRKKEGEVTVDYSPQQKKKSRDQGEYVEYEEIKD